MQSVMYYRKTLMIVLAILAIVVSVGFTVWHVNQKLTSNIHNLEMKVERLDHKIERLSSENKKLKQAVGKFYRYNQSIVEHIPEDDKSKMHQIGDSVGDLLKGFIF